MSLAILIVEDEPVLAKNIKRFLEQHGHEAESVASGADGLARHESYKPDVVLLDLKLPDMSGLEVLKAIKAKDAAAKVVLLTAHGNVQNAVEAMKAGAADFLAKPIALGELKLVLERVAGHERLECALSYYREREAGESGAARILGASAATRALKARIAQIIAAERRIDDGPAPPVLVTGETGTGKELVARALHYDGVRSAGPFVELNCAALPAHLVESELFGYERGAFTDARARKLGLIETADGGSLLLDEIGELDLATQAKLLKVLEDRCVRRLGAVRDRTVDVRFLAATNRPLEDLVAAGRFRADLLYRLRVLVIEVLPLRARGEDVLLLADAFLDQQRKRYRRPGLAFSLEARRALASHDWPGNVRELRNVVEQAALLASGDMIESDALAFLKTPLDHGPPPEPQVSTPPGSKIAGMERDMILQALESTAGNVTRAAMALGLSRDTLRYRMQKYNLRARSEA